MNETYSQRGKPNSKFSKFRMNIFWSNEAFEIINATRQKELLKPIRRIFKIHKKSNEKFIKKLAKNSFSKRINQFLVTIFEY